VLINAAPYKNFASPKCVHNFQ